MTVAGNGDPRHACVAVFSLGVYRLRGLRAVLGAERLVLRPRDSQAGRIDAVAGWGHKPTADGARAYAARHGLPYLALEDGFLRSVGLGRRDPPLSLVVDDVGIYYDARQPSRLEALLARADASDPLLDAELLERARRCRERIVEAELSKYNASSTRTALPSDDPRPIVLVADQTRNDASVAQGLADATTFHRMLEAARQRHPGHRVVVKVHPEVSSGRKRGYLADRARSLGVELWAGRATPVALLRRTSHAYVCTSQLGFDALLAGVPVTCFGAPFYAGWGLTTDERRIPRRGRPRSLEQLVAATLLLYPIYLHPLSDERCDAEQVIEHLALQREQFASNARAFFCFGFSRWKRPFVRRYLGGPDSEVRFVASCSEAVRKGASASSTLVAWGSRRPAELSELAARIGAEVWRMEDGFLRSVRLGSELTPPGSLVLDSRGIYYDPRAASDLEASLQTESFTPAELERAARLRSRIVEHGLSKYNAATPGALRTRARTDQPVAFVPGQVEDDASVTLGSPHVRSNEALLRAVRQARPGWHVLYKPHPDVVIGNRRGHVEPGGARLWDELVEDASVAACLAVADEVHTMTSLVGFEALLRGITVVTWGQPFYCGWGLTRDMHPPERRGRRLSVDELVAAALIRYPRYYSFRAHAFCSPEDFVDELIRLRDRRAAWLDRAPWLLRRAHSLGISVREWGAALARSERG